MAWIGALVGGVISGVGSYASSKKKAKQTSTPWEAPWLAPGMNYGQGILNNGVPSELSYLSSMGYGRALATAQRGGVGAAAGDLGERTLRGEFLGSNPWTDAVAGDIGRQMGHVYQTQMLPSTTSMFSRGGSFRSPHAQSAVLNTNNQFMTNLGETMNKFYAGQYNEERARQQQMIGMMPILSQAQYSDIDQAIRFGVMPNQYQWDNYRNYMSGIRGSGFTTSRDVFSDPWGSALGGALAGGNLMKLFGGGTQDYNADAYAGASTSGDPFGDQNKYFMA